MMNLVAAKAQLHCSENHEELAEAVVIKTLALCQSAIEKRGRFTIALSSSLILRGVYSLMASAAYRREFDWEHIHFFWADERWVSPTNSKSHYGSAAEVLLSRIDIPIENIHPIRTQTSSPIESATLYQKELAGFFKSEPRQKPAFDLIHLSLGSEGNLSSLFPRSPALAAGEDSVVAASVPDELELRVTFTAVVLNRARHIFILASGPERAWALRESLGPSPTEGLPAAKIRPLGGRLLWFVDKPAASLLDPSSTSDVAD